MPKNKTAFVTGAEGFIGSHLAVFLAAKGWEVIGTYLVHQHPSLPVAKNLTLVQCDLRNGQRVAHMLETYRPTHVFHLGAQSLPTVSWADPVWTFESNIMGSLHLFEGMRHMEHRPCRRIGMLQRRIRTRSGFGDSGQGKAAASSLASLRDQQGLP